MFQVKLIILKTKWFHIISPCLLAAAFCILIIIDGIIEANKSNGWSMLAVYFFIPVFWGLIIMDLIIKKITKNNRLSLWLSEAGLILISIIAYALFR